MGQARGEEMFCGVAGSAGLPPAPIPGPTPRWQGGKTPAVSAETLGKTPQTPRGKGHPQRIVV